MRMPSISLVIALAAAGCGNALADVPATPAASACVESALRFAVSDDSPGMGHVGILLSLRNASATACELPAEPVLSFVDATGKTVATALSSGNVVLAPGTSAYAHATWSEGSGGNTPCTDATKFVVSLLDAATGNGASFSHPLPAHLCSSDGTTISFVPYAFSLAKDPVAVPGASISATPSASP